MSGSDMPPLKQVARSQPRAAVPRLFPIGLVISPIRARNLCSNVFLAEFGADKIPRSRSFPWTSTEPLKHSDKAKLFHFISKYSGFLQWAAKTTFLPR